MNVPTGSTAARLRRSVLTALSAVMVLMALSAPALAQPRYDDHRDWGRMSWQEHEREARRWHRMHRVPYYPGVVYAPPPVVYAPPPPPPGISLIIPLDFR
jgi:hypothetical protein